jgi:hypothetical protein
MITPVTFAFQVTHACPLACAHCSFSADMSKTSTLTKDQILSTIQHIDSSKIKLVAFSGGEPFLLGQTLVDAVHEASRLGFGTRIVTSAYFGENISTAERRLKELHQAGLNELSISYDDFHAEFVSFACIRNVFQVSKKLGLTVAINVTRGRDSKWTAEKVRKELGLSKSEGAFIFNSPLTFTGRARSSLRDIKTCPKRYIGPCPHVIASPALNATNKLMACCGVIPETDALILDNNFKPENMEVDFEKSQKSALLNWLHLRGPYAIMEWISAKYDLSIIDKDCISGNCEACYLLFNTAELVDKLPNAIEEKAEEIAGGLRILETLGLLGPNEMSYLWKDKLTTSNENASKGSVPNLP